MSRFLSIHTIALPLLYTPTSFNINLPFPRMPSPRGLLVTPFPATLITPPNAPLLALPPHYPLPHFLFLHSLPFFSLLPLLPFRVPVALQYVKTCQPRA